MKARESLALKSEAVGRVEGRLYKTPSEDTSYKTLLDKKGQTLPLALKTNRNSPMERTIIREDS